ncbi:hypothetical protein [Aliivibrio fischeri]|uniref:hypothetical protein n=1 Tax=Aliivibrio fischeri TaxID=668 RepID=UPI00080EAB9E|nr:hypothetical protein [Aliivibrio fischeri]OCH05939.1 hypothetical protein A6E10_07695 [Aliivibrio fischeri]OCH07637.1 hypothetical protein A6E11_15625 [Aliivibrio fischeri]OCH09465.1 hypothetical protein A6E09_14985 [Aliivibrio fischeri]OCH29115.1 hypothetical protein A6E12_06905 [Aliivibrio fischeri]OCH62487.1 hypothetical protein A6D98_05650 [Aliivibrio fischeri]
MPRLITLMIILCLAFNSYAKETIWTDDNIHFNSLIYAQNSDDAFIQSVVTYDCKKIEISVGFNEAPQSSLTAVINDKKIKLNKFGVNYYGYAVYKPQNETAEELLLDQFRQEESIHLTDTLGDSYYFTTQYYSQAMKHRLTTCLKNREKYSLQDNS